jgi:hypothetical protein
MPVFARLLLLTICATAAAQAGGTAVDRKEFKQSDSYPYVFRPVCYLATSGPIALRFAVSPPECGDRRAPKLTGSAKTNPKPEAPPPPVIPPPPSPAAAPAPAISAAPAFPPPTNAPAPKPPAVDFSQFPAELVEAFKKGREGSDNRNYLFDPIFQPALPDDLPKSKATLREK